MNDFPWLTALIVVPLVGAVVTAALPYEGDKSQPKKIALGFSVLTLVLAAVMATQYDADGGFQFTETHEWINVFGAHYALGVDGMALVLVLLTTLLVPVVIGASWFDADQGNTKAFFAWALALEALSLGVFMATDVFLFYVLFEATLIPGYFLIGGFGREGRQKAAIKFLIFQLAGGLVMLAAVVGLYVVSADAGHPTYLLSELSQIDIDPDTQKWLFAGFFFAFAVKAPLFPVHTWLADATEKATPGTSVLLVCVLDKIGTYGDAALLPRAVPRRLAVGDAVRGHAGADLDRVRRPHRHRAGRHPAPDRSDLAEPLRLHRAGHLRVHHAGHVRLDPLHGQPRGRDRRAVPGRGLPGPPQGHGLDRRRSPASRRPPRCWPACSWSPGSPCSACPGLSQFVSEIMVIIAAFQHHWWIGAIAVSAIVLAAWYILWMYQRLFTGPGVTGVEPVKDLNRREIGALAPLLLALVLFGFYPMPLLDVINPATTTILEDVGVHDPAPTVDTAGQESH